MSTLKVLKEYLVGEGGYLLNDDNNGKTVMLSGAWGSGKTHFWLEDIKPKLTEKKQKNIYISLYGRESISELKFEVLKEAYNLEVKDDIISKSASMLSTIAPSLGEKSLVDGFDKLNKKAKEKKAEEILKSGSIICLDDFERKSSKIDLNDLFGYISQLALDYQCKVVIILNSDVFEGEEANVFKTVKEKTVNKFFYFEPTVEELFKSIFYTKTKEKKYKYACLRKYKNEIFRAIQETEELNARIYIQVLDNCLEWIDDRNGAEALKVLILATVYFTKTHKVLDYAYINYGEERACYRINYSIDGIYSVGIVNSINYFARIFSKQYSEEHGSDYHMSKKEYLKRLNSIHHDGFISAIERRILESKGYSEISKQIYIDDLYENENDIIEFWKYGYRLYCMDETDEATYNKITNFIKTGILPKKSQESGEFTPTKG